jgi:hypothetical protein
LKSNPETWSGVSEAPAYVTESARNMSTSGRDTRVPSASRGLREQNEASGAGLRALPNPLPDWCVNRKPDVGLLLEWWERGRDGAPPIHEWTALQMKQCTNVMNATEKGVLNRWKNTFSKDYILVHRMISEKMSASTPITDRVAAAAAVQLEVTSRVAQLRKGNIAAIDACKQERFFERAQRMARDESFGSTPVDAS